MRKPTLAIRPYDHSKTHRFVLDLRPFGRGRKFFRTRDEAKAERLRVLTALEIHGREAVGLPQRELSDFITAKLKLSEYGKTINDATHFYLDHLERVRRCKTTVAQLADEVITAKRKDGLSPEYTSDLKLRLARFCRDFGDRPIAGITVEELDNWLRALPGSPKSRANFRANTGVLFSYATKRRMLDFNPIMHTAKPKLLDHPPEIFAVDELRALLEAANRVSPDVVPMLAIGAFAGLRDAEIQRLVWSEVDLARGHIEVKAAKAKSARRRIVPIQPNLAAWLRPCSGMTEPVVPAGARGKIKRVRKEADLTRWPQNGLRHSFASYRLGAIHDAPRVASELGHTSPQMLYSTYRELVLPEEAERYWKITPEGDATNVIPWQSSKLAGTVK
jgi:integrase